MSSDEDFVSDHYWHSTCEQVGCYDDDSLLPKSSPPPPSKESLYVAIGVNTCIIFLCLGGCLSPLIISCIICQKNIKQPIAQI